MNKICDCDVLFIRVNYASSDGQLLRQTVRAKFIFINKTNDALINADRAIAIIDQDLLNSKTPLLKSTVLKVSEIYFLTSHTEE